MSPVTWRLQPTEVPYHRETPAPIVEARLAVDIADRARAATYARGELAQAHEKLAQMEDLQEEARERRCVGQFARKRSRSRTPRE